MASLGRLRTKLPRYCVGCLAASIAALGMAAAPASLPSPVDRGLGDERTGVRWIDSVAQLRQAFRQSGQQIRMKPGVYRITDVEADNKTVFQVTGSGNYFDLRGVVLQLDTRLLAALRGKVHDLSVYRLLGDELTFAGATFEDIGEEPPYQGLSDFDVNGQHITFSGCTFIVRGSAPYGYGDLFGKGAGAKVRLQKHAAMAVRGDHTRVVACRFFIHTFGHAIHIHGANNTRVEDVYVEGALRPSNDILAEPDGIAARLGYQDLYGRPIRRDLMICLAEDAIRAYLDEGGPNPQRRTGNVTVANCRVHRMRGGIAMELASGKVVVRQCTVTECGYPGFAFGVPSNAVVRDCRGDARYAPLLHLGYSHKHHADVEIEWLDGPAIAGHNLLALINGSHHRIEIRAGQTGVSSPALKILCGESIRGDQADLGKSVAKNIELLNETPAEVILSPLSASCTVRSQGKVLDRGSQNSLLPTGPGAGGTASTTSAAGVLTGGTLRGGQTFLSAQNR